MSENLHIDLNSDLGESFGRYNLGMDSEIIPLVSSVNIACGSHAGDPVVMRDTVQLAAQAGVAIGAHPGYPDLEGFGRRDMHLSPDEAYCFVLFQLGALAGFCQAQGVRLVHVKPHGQLYNTAAKDAELARAIASAVYDFDPTLTLVGLAGSYLVQAGRDAGLPCVGEFFVDRNYTDEGALVPRNQPNALIEDADFAVKRLCTFVQTGTVESVSGDIISIDAQTACVHGDSPQALDFVRTCRHALAQAEISVCANR